MKIQMNRNSGLTLVEAMVTILVCSIVLAAIGIIMVDTQRGWQYTYTKVHGGAVSDAATAKTAFEKVVRKASREKYLRSGESDITVYYYSDWLTTSEPDRYARFYCQDETLFLEQGAIGADVPDHTMTLASDVAKAVFRSWPGAIQMMLTVQSSNELITATSTAVLHNE